MKQYNYLNFFADKNFAQTYTNFSPTNCTTGFHCSYMFQLKTAAIFWELKMFKTCTLSNKNPSARNYLSPEAAVAPGTVAIIIRVV